MALCSYSYCTAGFIAAIRAILSGYKSGPLLVKSRPYYSFDKRIEAVVLKAASSKIEPRICAIRPRSSVLPDVITIYIYFYFI